ncbi:Mammalian cell entry related domain protein [Solidesulfovibrio carbinoliphilus subsp. oakridgensis]|uniref:Mammalian cell entry related domain protein n=1 Tax=Solidesulfovibrio carbinoliphilus subsp. oakridgensis TaxID=694327 RepID=G7QBE9_9BACT|nr:MlaD family protein [Solidesulfovibrio carbinoliphilus]EHJ49372.1 Mammalian cell entry related domain protein [Solidesulfovibrio carbinoliphilus subsp. oakridgensis]
MSAKTNKTMIGAFVLGALVLAVGAIVALGSGMFFTKKFHCIMFFPNSVSGLEVGAPVVFRGVPIGSVTEISIEADASRLHFYIPVVIEILDGKITLASDKQKKSKETLVQVRKESPDDLLTQLIDKGLRAQLVTQSFVTGQLAVSLDLMPDTPVRLVGESNLPEIPTVPSTFEKLTETIKQLPLQELVDRLIGAVTGIEKLVNSPELARMPGKIDSALNTGTDLLNEIKSKVAPLAQNLDEAVQNYSELAKHLDRRTEGISSSAKGALDSFDLTLKDSRVAIGNFQKIVNSNSPTVTDLNRALGEIANAARAIRELSSYLERHPEALIQGKGGPQR